MKSVFGLKPVFQSTMFTRLFHGASRAFQQQTVAAPVARNTLKALNSRKTFSIDLYKSILDSNEIVLFVHRNNLVKADNDRFRQEIIDNGGKFTVIKNSLMKVLLKFENHSDPASKSAKRFFMRNKDRISQNPLIPLLKGPTGIISIKECDPSKVFKILKFLKSTNEKLFLIGGKIESKVFDINQIDEFKNLKTKPELQLELAGILTMLSGAGLVQVLQAAPQSLYLTMKSHELEQTPKDTPSE